MKKIKILILVIIAFFALSCSDSNNEPAIEGKEGCSTGDVNQSGWVAPNPRDYEFSMTLISQVKFGDKLSVNGNSQLAAFCGDECRGLANLTLDNGFDVYVCNLTIYSNTVSGEKITLRAYDADGKIIYDKAQEFTFQSNNPLGGITNVISISCN
jgi:hypothetical protein